MIDNFGDYRSTIAVKTIEEGVEFKIFVGKPDGISDIEETIVSLFGQPPWKINVHPWFIFLPPGEKPYHYINTWAYWVPQYNHWVGFDFSAYQEKNVGPLEENLEGPYLLINEPPPIEEEVIGATKEGRFVKKIIYRL